MAFPRGLYRWAKQVQSASTRSDVLRILIQKVFGSPRDAVLLRMLREFVMCGWVDNEAFEMMGKKVAAQMMVSVVKTVRPDVCGQADPYVGF